MNISHSPTLPSLSVFNKLILDSLGLWGGEIVDVKFDVAATEEQRKKVLNKAFEEHRNNDGTFGPTSSVLKAMEDNAPQGDVLQRKARTIRLLNNEQCGLPLFTKPFLVNKSTLHQT
jgi:hypothetical protein